MTRTVACIAAVWCAAGLGFSFGAGWTAIATLGALYVVGVLVLIVRYRTSRFGRTWIPRLVGQHFEWPPLVRLRSTSPPFGTLLANVTAVALAIHLPFVVWFGIARR